MGSRGNTCVVVYARDSVLQTTKINLVNLFAAPFDGTCIHSSSMGVLWSRDVVIHLITELRALVVVGECFPRRFRRVGQN